MSHALGYNQGGNRFGGVALIGTLDNFDFAFETNAVERMRLLAGGALIKGATTQIGSETLRVTGGTAIYDFTSTTAFQVTKTGGANPVLIVDTANDRVGVNVQPLSAFHSKSGGISPGVGEPAGLFECVPGTIGTGSPADCFAVTLRRDDSDTSAYNYLTWQAQDNTTAFRTVAQFGAGIDTAVAASFTGRLDCFLSISGVVTNLWKVSSTSESGGVFDLKPFVAGNGNLGTASFPWRKLYSDYLNQPSSAAPGSPANGDTWNDSTQKTFVDYPNGINQYRSGSVFVQTASQTVANTVTETTLTATGVGTLTLPANFFVSGKTIRIKASGVVSDTGTPTNTVNIKLGGTTVATTGAVAFSGALSNNAWFIEAEITCRTTGVGGTVFVQGRFDVEPGNFEGMPNTTTDTVNTTTTLLIDVTFTWGTASASNTITCTNLTVEVLE